VEVTAIYLPSPILTKEGSAVDRKRGRENSRPCLISPSSEDYRGRFGILWKVELETAKVSTCGSPSITPSSAFSTPGYVSR